MIGFDRSAFAAIPKNRDGNQNANRVVVRFMRRSSGAPIKNSNQTSNLLVFRIKTKLDNNKACRCRASRYQSEARSREFDSGEYCFL